MRNRDLRVPRAAEMGRSLLWGFLQGRHVFQRLAQAHDVHSFDGLAVEAAEIAPVSRDEHGRPALDGCRQDWGVLEGEAMTKSVGDTSWVCFRDQFDPGHEVRLQTRDRVRVPGQEVTSCFLQSMW